MATRDLDILDRAILAAIRGGDHGASGWLRFLATREARRLGKTSLDVERSLRRLHDRGCLALAFGLERGGLTDLGVLVARRVGHRPEGFPITVEVMPAKAPARAS